MIPSISHGQLWTARDISDVTWDSSTPQLILVLALEDEGVDFLGISVTCLVDGSIREIHIADCQKIL